MIKLGYGLPLAYLGDFCMGFGHMHSLQSQKCCWLLHLELLVYEVELGAQVHQISHYSSHLHRALPQHFHILLP